MWLAAEVVPYDSMRYLHGKKIVSIASNLPGPTACHRLASWGADVVKIEPPAGDQLQLYYPAWHHRLHANQTIVTLNLKSESDRQSLDRLLSSAHLLLTSSLSNTLAKLELDWKRLQARHKQLSLLQVFSYPDENRPGHDLNFQLHSDGLLTPPAMPRSLYADLIGAERIVAVAAMMLHHPTPVYDKIYLCDAVRELSIPVKYGATIAEGPLGGSLPGYNLYQCKDGWIALCALEPHFFSALSKDIQIENLSKADLVEYFSRRPVSEALAMGRRLSIPISSTSDLDPM
jgi:alpha-methylacyl-CoA racemase